MNGRPVRVLQVIDTLSMGGAETWLMELLRQWAKSGDVQMDFLLTSGNRGLFDDEAQRLGAKLHYLPYNRRALPEFARGFRRILRRERYDAIHDHQDYTAGWHFLLGGKALPKRRIVHVHNPSFGIRHTYGVNWLRRATAMAGKYLVGRYATQLCGTSHQILTEFGFEAPAFRHLPKTALHCGFSTDRFAGDTAIDKRALCREFGWPENSKIILFAGRMDKSPDLGHARNHKNSGFAVDIAIACMQSQPRMRAIFAGKTSPALKVLEHRLSQAAVSDRVIFAGIRSDIGHLMLAADVLLFPSRGEGLGMVAVEAQAAGLPVLASSAVPRECVVIPELVTFRDIAQGPQAWSNDLLRLTELPRDNSIANRRVAASPFAIENSLHSLSALYRRDLLP